MLNERKHTFSNHTRPSMLLNNPSKFWSIVNNKSSFGISRCSQLFSTDIFAESMPMNLSPLIPSHNFPKDPTVIEFHGIVSVIESIKMCSSCCIDYTNAKLLLNTKLSSGLFLTKYFSSRWKQVWFRLTGKLVRSFQSTNLVVNHPHLFTGPSRSPACPSKSSNTSSTSIS